MDVSIGNHMISSADRDRSVTSKTFAKFFENEMDCKRQLRKTDLSRSVVTDPSAVRYNNLRKELRK